MEMNVLMNFHEDWMQNVACRVLTRANVDEGRRTDAGQNGITIAHHAQRPCTLCIGELKMLIMSNFSFCHKVFKRSLLQRHQKASICGKGFRTMAMEVYHGIQLL